MNLETAAKILRTDEDKKQVEGEFWVENSFYEVFLEYERTFGRVRVEIDHQDLEDELYVETHHTMTGEGVNRSYAGTEADARMPETNEEMEAYVLKSLNSADYGFNL